MKEDMIHGRPGRSLLLFTIPMVLGNLFQQFYSIIDSVIVGRYVGEDALAAVGASFSVTMVFIAVATGSGIGCSVVISQLFGAKRISEMKTAISTAISSIFGLSILLGVVGAAANDWILKAMGTPENIFADSAAYLRIYFFGLPFLFLYNILAAVFNAQGDSRTPLGLLVFSSLLNIGLDILFVIKFKQGVAGVAWATLIAQGVSALVSFFLMVRRLKRMDGESAPFYSVALLGQMVRVAVPSIVQQSIVSVGMLLVQTVINSFGSVVVAGCAAAAKIDSIAIMPMVAVGNALSTFTAQNIGAGRPERVKKGLRASVLMVAVVAAAICLLAQLWGKVFLTAFLDEETSAAAIGTGLEYLRFLSFFYVFMGLKCVVDGVLRGAGDMAVFMCGNLVNLSLRVILAFTLSGALGVQAVWIAVPVGWAANYLISGVRYLSGKWKQKRLLNHTAE